MESTFVYWRESCFCKKYDFREGTSRTNTLVDWKKIPPFEYARSPSKTKNIPIIFLSGKDSSQDVEQAYECGGIDYVVKPFVTIELITKANSYVRLKQLEDKFELLKDTQNV